jgi:hypothetical protein
VYLVVIPSPSLSTSFSDIFKFLRIRVQAFREIKDSETIRVLVIGERSIIRIVSSMEVVLSAANLQIAFDQLLGGPAVLKPCKVRVVIPNLHGLPDV